ncbi:hypothetical protein L3X38_002592 [Prunus dulcis]|uniref:Uncharacterized protein n=1 Tax=Prunus dulcis TaxID=3755 RepID=A0AAD4ZL95_PRUDU|nr:hypothetical protein L3X38_002592 [Prunus dulcis]
MHGLLPIAQPHCRLCSLLTEAQPFANHQLQFLGPLRRYPKATAKFSRFLPNGRILGTSFSKPCRIFNGLALTTHKGSAHLPSVGDLPVLQLKAVTTLPSEILPNTSCRSALR